jgi:intraflagellar transport protein 81
MSEQLKYIVGELNREPFSRGYNLITFDSLDPLSLLQVLTDVLADIDPKQKIDVREEAADQTAIRIFTILRILKYRPPSDAAGLEAFRKGIVQGDKPAIYPVLEWLFKRMPELKERAYLARFLVKVDVPQDFMVDPHLTDLYAQYEQLLLSFKESHRQMTTLKASSFNTTDIKKDIASMEDEKDQLIKRVDRLKRKVEAAPNSAPMLAVARNLRMERDREEQIQKQKYEQRNLIVQYDQRIQRLQQQIKEAKQAAIGLTPKGLLQNLEEETVTNKYVVVDVHPKELAMLRGVIQNLQKIVTEPAMGQSDLDVIRRKIGETNAEINKLVEKRMMAGNPTDDKLSLFRQQAAIVSRKKKAAAETVQQIREEVSRTEAECEEKRSRLHQSGGGDEVLKGEEFKRYVNKLRTKNTTYKKKKTELSSLRAELGVLARTEEVLAQRNENINRKQSAVEARHGVAGYRDTQDALENVSTMKSEFDQMKGRTLEDISYMVQQLNNKIASRKSQLAPMIKELRPLRQQAQDLTTEHTEKKNTYDSMSAGLESNRSKLEQDVRALREEIAAEESRFHYISMMRNILELQLQRVNEELKLYVSTDQADKKRSFREQYTRRIQEQENLGKALREKQKSIRDGQETSAAQVKMWRDVERLLEAKRRLATGEGLTTSSHHGTETYYGSSAGGGGEPARQMRRAAADEDRLIL